MGRAVQSLQSRPFWGGRGAFPSWGERAGFGRPAPCRVLIYWSVPPGQQVADEKTCMQFSIRRPKLPSSETHPEESMYKRLDVAAWLRHLNELGQVEEGYKLRKVSGAGGPGPLLGGCPLGQGGTV